ncbi:MAG: hypothetical protein Q8S35_03245 [bacterium]|nr:hypothetical protein [bacterium]
MIKLIPILTLAVLFSATAAHAQVPGIQADVDVSVNAQANSQETSTRGNSEAQVNAGNKGGNASTTTRGQITAESHRSMVATFVQSLLSVADRDRAIGTEVRAVANSQNDSASTTVEAMTKVEKRSNILDFLFGTDWKNAGAVRSNIAKSNADIQRLENTLSKTTDASVRADLEAQISLLKDELVKLDGFVTENEQSFSLFGWFTKLFVKTEA